ncbi:MAG: hypothetical protein ACRC2T_17605 [Thermoguttaceae bacterium]
MPALILLVILFVLAALVVVAIKSAGNAKEKVNELQESVSRQYQFLPNELLTRGEFVFFQFTPTDSVATRYYSVQGWSWRDC